MTLYKHQLEREYFDIAGEIVRRLASLLGLLAKIKV